MLWRGATRKYCHEVETAIFAARTNLPVSDFQTWQVCPGTLRYSCNYVSLWSELGSVCSESSVVAPTVATSKANKIWL